MERVNARLAVLSAHLEVPDPIGLEQVLPAVIEPWCTSGSAAPHGSLKGNLTIVDERTGKKYQVPISEDGTVKSIDLKKITKGKHDKGIRLYDPGYLNTAPVRSSISCTDGDEGTLRYRGYPIEELAESSTFLEVAYLLIYGNLPSQSQLADWEYAVSQHSAVPQGLLDIIQAMPQDAHPSCAFVSAMSALSLFYPDANPSHMGQDVYKSKQVRDKQIFRILGQAPIIAAATFLKTAGKPHVLPSSNLSYAENVLYMLHSLGNRSYKPNPRLARVLDVIFILLAEHEMNCSTAAARHLASSGVDVYTAITGAIGALCGPLHGGAIENVPKMLSEIGTIENIPDFIECVKNKKKKLSGFGHRIYKNYDPRERVIRRLADEVFSIVGKDPLFQVAVALEKAALSDEYFVKRKLYPNVDFYSGLVYRAIGVPPQFTAIPRMVGYLAHWLESLDDPDTKIMRPQQVKMERVNARLVVLSAHLEVSDPMPAAIEPWCTSSVGAPHGSLKGNLTIVHERTGKKYRVSVSEHGTVRSTDLKKITTGNDDKGIKLYDPGYLNTAPVRSSISYIDGDEGILRYRGYPIEELAESSTFLEVAYLLIYGNLPTQRQLADLEFEVSQHLALPQGLLSIPQDAHPSGAFLSAMSTLSLFHPDANPSHMGQDIYKSKQVVDKQIFRVLGQAPTIAANAFLRTSGKPPVLPSCNLSYAENLLYMLDSMGDRSYKPNPRLARVLDIIFILHAEHEMNCSTAAARHLASSGVDVYTAIAGAVGALYGPLHGGAVEAVSKMLSEIGSVENIPKFIRCVKNKKRRMSGFGHRVYKNYDPRAKVVKKLAYEVFNIVGKDPLVEVAVALEKAAVSDEYFVKRKLYPNVDYPIIPRMAGYLAHWLESLDDPDTKIMRPQQAYTGVWLRHYASVK
ncbi:unnamed protein product [Eruca vesicaria subsp. sativa]|uniref:Citrate synthase n=1 Tax=Eruca vesicaria subsp. sativa TaxID=29727 RepID=A0ABC8MB09_ERUVS|nr:unnamed protein product [Eruca vesicaria subsp. sativa]